MKQVVTVGLAVVAGAALLEVALVPGILIGGAAVLAPRYRPTLPGSSSWSSPECGPTRA